MSTQYCLVDLSAEEQNWARRELPGSRPQSLLHNFLMRRIEEFRSRLETATGDEVLQAQIAIREARTLLGELHSNDPESVRKLYEHRSD